MTRRRPTYRKQRHHLGSALVTVGLVATAAVVTTGCEDATPPPKTPEQPSLGYPGVSPTAPSPGGPQVGVIDTPPAGAAEMNAAARGYYQQGMAAFANGQLTQAEALFKQATAADPKAYQAFYSLGVVEERLGRSGAASSYRKAFTVVPKYERALVAYGLLLARQGKTSEADAFLSEKRGRMQKSAPIAAALAEVKSLAKDTSAAQRIAQEALKLDPDYRPAMVTIARDHYRNRRLDLALYALKAILDGFDAENPPRDKNNAEAHLLRAYIWAEQGFRADAMSAFRRAMELRPDLVPARLRLATYLLEAGGAAEALPILQQALQYDADNLAAHLSLGDAHRLLGQYTEAKRQFEWVLQRDQSLPQVHYNLALLYLFAPQIPGLTPLAQVDQAIQSLQRFAKLRRKDDPDDHEELLQRAKLKKSEIEALQKAAQPQPAAQPPQKSPASPPKGK
ncbi:MAG: tetratricopeptide repeat protein [Deltaproteobacteria bacterium]|jgi:Tfp pilus assembly protein PilF|nr:tetratricopeptide repeat protein [Deltaproteobacteria bacterium]MBW2534663.1 tetratricopeptide repeat protein [Deltaproteobacteria bacterium]